MINYIDAFLSIQKVKRDLKTMTFEDAKDLICGYNETADSFEFNRGNVCGSVYNENNKPVLKGESCFSVYDSEHTKNGIAFHGTESEIYQKAREALIDEMRSYILADYHPTNAKEFEILGRALCGCNGITILDDGGVMNGYGYTRKRNYSNADWRAIELIDESIRYLKNREFMEDKMKYKIYAGYYEIYVTESELNKPYALQLKTDSIDEVCEYLDEIDDTILVEKSIADEIGNYDLMIRIKNGEVKEVFDGSDLVDM